MNSLPPELLLQILSHLPPSSYPPVRLTSRLLNTLLSPLAFPSLPAFLDPDSAQNLLAKSLREARARNVTSVWSPLCCVPAGLPIPRSFLLALCLALRGRQWVEGGEAHKMDGETEEKALRWESDSAIGGMGFEGEEDEDEEMTVEKLAEVTGREDLRVEVVRKAMFRYALYLSYVYGGAGEAPSLWVFDEKAWWGKS
ncbi:hypothetical protein E4U13_003018 [Claviceps humidiphila]|uniref:F-box domain-containing protein n=1 Tax=Claviceps humidiphila TaxID=1294629 RepID=A0A9P7QBG9_9HYPO|nr:hypothetical protein E4U13_003018 [Claviceps humidiphila]